MPYPLWCLGGFAQPCTSCIIRIFFWLSLCLLIRYKLKQGHTHTSLPYTTQHKACRNKYWVQLYLNTSTLFATALLERTCARWTETLKLPARQKPNVEALWHILLSCNAKAIPVDSGRKAEWHSSHVTPLTADTSSDSLWSPPQPRLSSPVLHPHMRAEPGWHRDPTH